MAESSNPMDLLKEEMESDDISVRINAMHRIKIISTLIGVDATKSQLLPYLDGLIKKEDDEVLYAIAEEIGNIAPILGNQVNILVPYLETLASVEETVVRDASVKSLLTVAGQLSDGEIVSLFCPMILRLCGGEWFTSRVSAVNLIPGIYTRAGNQKNPLKQKFIELCGEETPMVRRAVAMRIGDLASGVEKDVLHELITIFKQLTGDEQDSVKMLCLESLRQIAKILNKDENKTHIIPVVIAATEDKSWRVRQALSRHFAQIAEALGKEITDHHLIQNFTVVLRDAEIDVRAVAVQSLARLLQMNLLSQEKLMTLIPHIQALGKDSNPGVKVGIIQVLLNMIPLVGKDVVLTKLYPTSLDLIEDEDSEVRIESFKVISKVAQHLNADILTSLMPHIKTHLSNTKWRVRLAALDCVIDLALIFQSLEVFQKHLEPLFLTHLGDKACSIRDCAIRRIPELITLFKVDWLNNVLLPKTLELLTKPESTYLLRGTVMYALRAMAQVVPNDYVNDKLLPHLIKGARDPVPNIRVITMKVFKGIIHKLDSSVINSTIKPLLQELTADSDRDVQFYAQDTLSAI